MGKGDEKDFSHSLEMTMPGSRYRLKKNVRYAFPRFVIPSAVEGSFSLAVRQRVFDSRERETPYHGRAEAVLPLKDLAKGRGKRDEKDFSLSLEMTNVGERYSRIVSLLHGKSVRRHSPSFL